MVLIVPPQVEEVITRFDKRTDPFGELDLEQELEATCRTLRDPSDSERLGIWAEYSAFALLTRTSNSLNTLDMFFRPMVSGTTEDGKVFYFPDIAEIDAQTIDHWIARAKNVSHPVLKARYSDLVWELSPVIIKKKRRDPDMARLAIDS